MTAETAAKPRPGTGCVVTAMPTLDPRSPVAASALCETLASETRLLDSLIAILRQQRDAATRDDRATVADSVFAMQRVLHTLAEARRRRHAIYRMLGAPEHDGAPALAAALGETLDQEPTRALDALMTAARTLANEVEVNRTVLRQALAEG
ncbi:MAG TPA: flagellar export chaperone FlgN [Gemmatimonadaceae bacterium]|nr:flagellar export chaperone FlgN [Gemmatimonadaceae bacterium]